MTTTNPISNDAATSATKKHNKMLDAVEDIDAIARIMKALGNGQDDVDWLVVNWLGERLQKVHEAIDEHQN
jgi:hypothetical protein